MACTAAWWAGVAAQTSSHLCCISSAVDPLLCLCQHVTTQWKKFHDLVLHRQTERFSDRPKCCSEVTLPFDSTRRRQNKSQALHVWMVEINPAARERRHSVVGVIHMPAPWQIHGLKSTENIIKLQFLCLSKQKRDKKQFYIDSLFAAG